MFADVGSARNVARTVIRWIRELEEGRATKKGMGSRGGGRKGFMSKGRLAL